jgi:hypothetical protein
MDRFRYHEPHKSAVWWVNVPFMNFGDFYLQNLENINLAFSYIKYNIWCSTPRFWNSYFLTQSTEN